jgi:WD40 repeat protein
VDAVTAVAFTPSGRYVLTGASDGGVRLWRVSMAGPRLTRPRLRLMLDAAVTHLLVAPTSDLAVVATATGQLTCVQLP